MLPQWWCARDWRWSGGAIPALTRQPTTVCNPPTRGPTGRAVDAIPFEHMWLDDPLWFPSLLRGETFVGDFVFADHATLVAATVQPATPAVLDAIFRVDDPAARPA